MSNPFFKNHGPFFITDVLETLNIESNGINKDFKVKDIKDLSSSDISDITFFHSKNTN